MREAKFCLVVSGHGWGIRIVEAMACGCVPVIVEDNVMQPFEDVLPYETFSIRVRSVDLQAPAPCDGQELRQWAALICAGSIAGD